MALLAVDAAMPRLAKPYMGTIPTYTEQRGQRPPAARDNARSRRRALRRDSVARRSRATAFADQTASRLPNPALDRLYALGIDAFRVAQAFAEGRLERSSSTARPAICRSTRRASSSAKDGCCSSTAATSFRPVTLTRGRDAGGRAETMAAAFLAARGLVIVERNWRRRLGEIDLIARDGDMLVFVEVRLRTRRDFGGAAASIGARKRARLIAAARSLSRATSAAPPCRFDAILLDSLEDGAHRMADERHRRVRQAMLRTVAGNAPARAGPKARSPFESPSRILLQSVPFPVMDPEERIRTHFADSAQPEAGSGRCTCAGDRPRRGRVRRVPARRRQDPRLRQRRLGVRCAALRGRDGRPLRARAAGTSGDLACHRHVDLDRRRERLFVRADLRQAGSRARRQGRRAARDLDVGQFGQRRRRDRSGARSRNARRRADRQGRRPHRRACCVPATCICASRTTGPRASRRCTC